jgi:sialate O-acetylesterase
MAVFQISDSTGIWTVKLPAENEPGPHEILVNSSEGNVHLYDVLFGDVWLCSGQSNMQFSMSMVIVSFVVLCIVVESVVI